MTSQLVTCTARTNDAAVPVSADSQPELDKFRRDSILKANSDD